MVEVDGGFGQEMRVSFSVKVGSFEVPRLLFFVNDLGTFLFALPEEESLLAEPVGVQERLFFPEFELVADGLELVPPLLFHSAVVPHLLQLAILPLLEVRLHSLL
jgi:hypothetical protein